MKRKLFFVLFLMMGIVLAIQLYVRFFSQAQNIEKNMSALNWRGWDPYFMNGKLQTIEKEEQNKIGIPSFYDYRLEGRAPAAKNQGTFGTCWAFASLMALETALLPTEALDFSEDHMSLNNSFNLTQNEGGEYTMSMAYLLSWQGPVLEEEDPYGDEISPRGLKATKHVQEIQLLPQKDYEAIKKAVLLQGGVQSSLYTSLQNHESRSIYYNKETNAYSYIGAEKPNHDVVIVGWDDDYKKENFNVEVEGDGAFLCINSWGEDFGEDGYFYVSYYDSNIGIHNIVYTGVEAPGNYDHIYQSDLCGWIGQLGYGKEDAYFANVYTAGKKEALKAVGFYATGPETKYRVYVSRDIKDTNDFANRKLVAEGMFANAGYYTVPLSELVWLEDESKFAVMVEISTPNTIHPVAIEYPAEESNADVDLKDGEGYISYRGSMWESVEEEQNCNLCLKAYTVNR